MSLTVKEVEAARPKGKTWRLYDTAGMYLEIRPRGSRLWILRYRYRGKERRISLGPYPEVSLRAAREARDEARALLRQGVDPSAHRQAQRRAGDGAATVEAIAWEWLEVWRRGKAPGTIRTTRHYLDSTIIPGLGSRPIAELDPTEVLEVVRAVEQRGAIDTAHRILRRISMICRYAIRTGRATYDPTAHLREALAAIPEEHHPAIIDPEEWGALMRAIHGYEGHAPARAALRIAPLVVVRPGELRHAEWSEISLRRATWTIPGPKMKMRHDHIVPLARQVVEVLEELQPVTGRGRYVFPSIRHKDRPMSENTVNAALRSLGYTSQEVVGHGFRASFRTMGDEVLGFRVDLLEHQLAHAVRDANGRAYNRTSFLAQRREMMQRWADWCDEVRQSGAGSPPSSAQPTSEARRPRIVSSGRP